MNAASAVLLAEHDRETDINRSEKSGRRLERFQMSRKSLSELRRRRSKHHGGIHLRGQRIRSRQT